MSFPLHRATAFGITIAVAVLSHVGTRSAAAATVEMVRISTEDHVRLDGALWSGESRTAVFLIPGGLRSEFYTMSEWAEMFSAVGYKALLLNQRDHGAKYGLVTFDATCDDIRYGVDFLKARGAERVVLLGRSYGTVLVACFLLKHDPLVKAGILYAPLRDIHEYAVERLITDARQMIADGHGDEIVYVPAPGPPGPKVAYTYRVLVDKLGPDSRANSVELLKRLRGVPLLGIRDPADPLPGTVPPAQALLQKADPELDYVLLPDVRNGKKAFGAHFFEGRQREALTITLDWLKTHQLAP
jgi:pimeloyl-ACP methyl ester carboxylesterase